MKKLLLLVMILAPAFARAQTTPLTIGETFTITSKALGNEVRRINVYTAAGYDPPAGQRLPVLYMPDGGMAEDFLHVAGLVQVSVGNGTMKPVILVGIENTERRRDMTGPTSNAEDRKIAPRVGGSAAFRTFIQTELIPEVNRRYPTTSGRAIIGESLAGLFVVETFLLEPTMFDTYIALDPSLWWNDRKLVQDAAALLRARTATPTRLYLASSDETQIAADTKEFAAILSGGVFPGVSATYVPMPEEKHSTIYHPAALRAFRMLFKP